MSSSIDFRSDTVTLPVPSMYAALNSAKLGDDVFDDDPTVHSLQSLSAALLNKESALFVPSGTMGNLICCLVHCTDRVSEFICGDLSHLHLHEVGGTACLGGLHCRTVRNLPDGTFSLDEMLSLVSDTEDVHQSVTRMVALENTHNRCGGSVLPKSFIDSVCRECHLRGIVVHMDGARIFNAATALGVEVKTLVENVDSVMFCLSKGLCSPIGSMICGTKAFIEKARRVRKMLGGGMRQVGLLAACGIVSITEMTKRLDVDHKHARMLVDGLMKMDGVSCGGAETRLVTNIIFVTFDVGGLTEDANSIADRLQRDHSILVSRYEKTTFRLATHYYIEEKHIHTTLKAIESILKEIRKPKEEKSSK